MNSFKNAFDASEKYAISNPDGIVRHAEARIGDVIVEFAEAGPGWSAMPAGLHYVRNADEVYVRALKAGGNSLYEPVNRDYGDREAGVRDPAGNFWFIATHLGGKSYRPEILQDLNTYFSVKDAGRFIEFLEKALGAEVIQKDIGGSGTTIQHATVRIGDTVVELSEGRGPWGPRAVAHHYYVEDCDDVFARGLANGGKELQPMADQFYGDRSGALLDAWGNHWYIASHLEDLTTEEIAQRAAAAGGHQRKEKRS